METQNSNMEKTLQMFKGQLMFSTNVNKVSK